MSDISQRIANLSPEKRALFELHLMKKDTPAAEEHKLSRRAASGHIPLSFAQQRLWLLDQFEPGSPVYNIPFAVHLEGLLDVTALEMSINEIIQRHEALRTMFSTVQEEPVQIILSTPPLKLPLTDLRELPQTRQEKELRKMTKREARRPFDMAQGLLLRAVLVRLDEKKHVLLLIIHHIVADGWSMGVLFRELSVLYKSFCSGEPSPLPELPIQYADFAIWQRKWLQGKILEAQLSYWKEQLDGAPPLLELPTVYPRPAVQAFRGARYTLVLPLALTTALKTLCRQEEVTLFMLLLAGFKILLCRYTGQEDIAIGSPVANRNRIEIEKLIGFFVNTLVLRTDLSGNPTFREMLVRVREMCLGAYDHQDLPFEKLVEELQPERTQSHSPLIQVMFNLQNAPRSSLEFSGLTLKPLEVDSGTSKFDLSLTMAEETEGLRGVFEYNIDLFNEATIERMARNFQTILEGIVANPDQHLSEFSLLTQAERHQLLMEWNDTKTDYPRNKCIHHLFEEQVERSPDATALVCEDQQITYDELNHRANQLAHYLIDSGVRPDVLVGLYVDRSIEMMVGLLGILKAGGAYLPLDPAYPKERLSYMLEESKSPVLITQSKLKYGLPSTEARVIFIDSDWDNISRNGIENPDLQAGRGRSGPENLAYIIFTSGSTGQPKGVQIPHRAVTNFLTAMSRKPGVSCDDTLLAVTTLSFDIHVLELYTPLIVGGKVVIARRETAFDGEQLSDVLADSGVTIMQATPSTWRLMIAAGWKGSKHLKALCGGEAFPKDLVAELIDRAGSLWNMYGPTETTVWSTCCQLKNAEGPVLIGRPIANTQTYVLDAELQPVPVGVPGELYIGGDGVTQGYINRPDLTSNAFIPDPFSGKPDTFIYKTDDLVKYHPDGNIEYFDRLDNQLKVRGFRIEPGEIETILSRHLSVSHAIVNVYELQPGDQRLVAYLIIHPGEKITIKDVREHLRMQLPEYMVPQHVVKMEVFPLTPAGKIDRKSLPSPLYSQDDTIDEYVGPRTETERMLCAVWEGTFNLERIDINDNFFALGGHSLLAAQVISQVRKVFNVGLPLRSLFETPTVAGLAEHLQVCLHSEPPRTTAIETIPQRGASDHIPLSFAQQRLWLLEQLAPGNSAYNISLVTKITGALDRSALERSLNEIVSRHESLRTSFPTVNGRTHQHIAPYLVLELAVFDLRGVAYTDRSQEIRQHALKEAACPFDLTSGPVIRASLLCTDMDEHVLLLTIHHIAADGWSIGILFRELNVLYQAYSQGQQPPLPPLAIQYADFAIWHRQWLSGAVLEGQLNYWREQLAALPALQLPTDRTRPPIQTYTGSQAVLELSDKLHKSLQGLGQAEGATLYMIMLAAFTVLLHRYSGQDDIVVGSPIANRNRSEIGGLIGFFVNSLVMRTDVSADPDFRELLGRVRKNALDAYAHQDVPFEKLVEELKPERDMSRNPLFQVMFTLQNVPDVVLELADLKLNTVDVGVQTTLFDLDVYVWEKSEGLRVKFAYNTDLFDESTIMRMLEHYSCLLEGVVCDPDCRISELPLLTDEERQQLLVEWNRTETAYPGDACIHELFEAQVELTPGAVALVSADQQLTYRQLNDRANQLAHYLAGLGVQPGMMVGILAERSLETVIGLLGVLKAGGVYLPLDPGYPRARLAFMLEDARPPFLLTTKNLLNVLPGNESKVICLDTDWTKIAQNSAANPDHHLASDCPACVIYTSGSTGAPKGVVGQHGSAVNLIHWLCETYPLSAGEISCQKTSLSFIDSLWEIFEPLSQGARLVIFPDKIVKDIPLFVKRLAEHQVTRIILVPSLLRTLLEMCPDLQNELPKLRTWIASGEALSGELAQHFQQKYPQSILLNLYGSSEVMAVVTWCDISQLSEEAFNVSIGRPIANTQVFILDPLLRPVPIGVEGELHVGGVALAQGYLNRTKLTDESFIPNPFTSEPGARLYKTGDLAHYLPNSNIQFVGRIDHQVKLRGYRIELGEIETVLNGHPAVSASVVVVQEEKVGDKRLVAYLTTRQREEVTIKDVREHLRMQLPAYMVPQHVVKMELFPLTPAGKIDRKALPRPLDSQDDTGDEYIAPQTETERTLCSIWEETFRKEHIGINDHFFEIGGHSLLAVTIFSKIRNTYNIELPLATLFLTPTINEIAGRIDAELYTKSNATHLSSSEEREHFTF